MKQINQMEKYKILRDSIQLTYVYGRKDSRFIIIERECKRESTKTLKNNSKAQWHLKLKI